MNVHIKFEVRSFTVPVPQIIGGYLKSKNNGQSLDMPTLSFRQKFNGLLFGWTL